MRLVCINFNKKTFNFKKHFNNLKVINIKRFIKAFTKDTSLYNVFITKAKISVYNNSSASRALKGRKVLANYIIFKDIFNNIIVKELLEDINVFY